MDSRCIPLLFGAVAALALAGERIPDRAPSFTVQVLPIDFRNHSGPPIKESIAQMTGAGVCVLDYDLDGDVDLYFPDGKSPEAPDASHRLFRNEGGLFFRDATREAGVEERGWGSGCAVGDVDNDGDPDLYVTHQGPNVLFLNNGDGTFTRVSEAAGVDHPGWSTGAAFGDLDGDGLVDLYVCNYIDRLRADLRARCRYFGIEVYCGPNGLPGEPDVLYRNLDGRRFRDVTKESGVYSPETRGFSVLLVDLDGDRRPEIHVANDATIDLLFANRGGMRFEDVSLLSGAGYSAAGLEQSGMGSTAGDFDGDGDEDLYVTNFQRDYNTLFRNEGGLVFTDATAEHGLSLPALDDLGWGAHFLDAGNDGILDLFVANGHIYPELASHPEIGEPYAQNNQLFVGDGAGGFEARRPATDDPARVSRGTAVVDLDEDGALDVLVTNLDEAPDVYRGQPGGSWIRFQLAGTRSNRDGLGAVVRIRTAEGWRSRELRQSDGFLGSNETIVHFGLGRSERVEELEVVWPSGHRDRAGPLRGRSLYRIKEGLGCLP